METPSGLIYHAGERLGAPTPSLTAAREEPIIAPSMRAFSVVAALWALLGCEPAPIYVFPDAGPPPDAYVPPYAEVLYAPCIVDSQCEVLGEGAFCRRATEGPAGGFCTRECEDRTPCEAFGSHHHCLTLDGPDAPSICVPACRNGVDCNGSRPGYTCFGSIPPTGDGYCMSVCRSDAECGDGTVCNLDSGECVVPPIAAAAPFEGECASDDACTSGFCVEQVNEAGTPSGWVNGACLSPCILPAGFNSTDFFSGDTLPNAGCPSDAACIPAGGNAEGDLGTCYPSCASNEDCRMYYGCLMELGGHAFSRGICVPNDCRTGGCPAGQTCVNVMLSDGSVQGRCNP